ncbi:charged multivesicular body protein 6-A-like [Halichondria panicea]|uniref:charged multivesicular body protein 6-A-like n=1 Tax=Halichondria panicea TaxID=6063 RepID=UPI00312BAB66
MGGFFSRRRRTAEADDAPRGPSRVSEQDKAVLELKKQRDSLRKYQKRINTQMEKEREMAKQFLRDGKKEKAKLLLKKKRYLESLLEKTDQQLENLQQMVDTIEFAQIEMKVVEGLKTGNECLEQMHKIMSVEDVEQVMSDTQEAIEYQREIDELLGQNLTQEDEDAIAEELESIIQASLQTSLPEVGSKPLDTEDDIIDELPEVPTTDPTLAEEGETATKQKRQAVPA